MNHAIRRSFDIAGILLLAFFVVGVGAATGAVIAWMIAVFAP